MSDADEWKDSYICTDQEASYNFMWSDSEGSSCLKVSEPHDWEWKTKYLCNNKEGRRK